MTEFITRHGDILTVVTVVDDPLYLDEPFVESVTYALRSDGEREHGDLQRLGVCGEWRHRIATTFRTSSRARTTPYEWLKDQPWIPREAARGGVKTLYPEYRSTLNGGTSVNSLTVPLSKSAFSVAKAIADQSPKDGEVHVLPVQGNVYMLVADGINLTASLGADGILLVNSGPAQMSDKILAAVKQLATASMGPPAPNSCFGANCPGAWGWASPYLNAVVSATAPPKPLRYIINTSASPEHVGGNEKIATSGFFPRHGRVRRGGRSRGTRRRRSSP